MSPAVDVASRSRIDAEAQKVPLISSLNGPVAGQSAVVSQVFMYVSDEELPKGRGKHKRKADDSDELALLAKGQPVTAANGHMVLAVFRDSQWLLRGVVERIKALLLRDVQMQADVNNR